MIARSFILILGLIATTMAQAAQLSPIPNPFDVIAGVPNLAKMAFNGEVAVLPSISVVRPPGDKPLVALTFKCPTELIGIQPPPIWLLHQATDLVTGALNDSGCLPFNIQQVCQ